MIVKITFGILIGLVIGYQIAKYRYYGEVDVLFWKIGKPK
jgi:hypothetical protein